MFLCAVNKYDMKNTATISTFKRSPYFLILLFTLLFSDTGLYAQGRSNAYLGIRGSASVSANRFGTIFCPSLFYRSGSSTIALGVTIQKHRLNASGIQLNYEYTLLDPSRDGNCYIDWLELYAFANLTYYNHAFLGRSVCEEEQLTNPELRVDLSALKLKALDAYTGFGLRIALGKNFKWFNGVGIGGYSVFNSPEGLFYNNKGLGLLVRTGISYQFRKQGKSNF